MRERERIKRVDKLTGEDVFALANDDLLLLVVQDFYESDACRRFSERIVDHEHVERYTHEIVVDGKLEQQVGQRRPARPALQLHLRLDTGQR